MYEINSEQKEDIRYNLDNVLKATGEELLQNAGTISRAQAVEKATEEYKKYQVQNLSPVEEDKNKLPGGGDTGLRMYLWVKK